MPLATFGAIKTTPCKVCGKPAWISDNPKATWCDDCWRAEFTHDLDRLAKTHDPLTCSYCVKQDRQA